jgi:short subunit dehydrogenase-like uncharacterized protein
MQPSILLYGAYGYTGQLIVRMAREADITLLVAGRDPERTRSLAEQYNMPWVAFSLDDAAALDSALQQVSLVLHAAGPFELTCRAMADACLRNRKHYVDITGEVTVFEYFKSRDAEARAAGIVFLPGAGFDVVPSDCLAAWLTSKLPGAESLTLALFTPGGQLSHGTATTVLMNAGRGGAIREDGKLRKVPNGWHVRSFDFGFTERNGTTIPWGDLSTAYTSTGIPNIRVYNCLPEKTMRSMRMLNYIGGLMQWKPVQQYLQKKIRSRPAGPSDEKRAKTRSYIWGEVIRGGGSRRAYLDLPEGYTLTAMTALAIGQAILAGRVQAGYQTPATALGPDFILEIPGVSRVEL